MNYFFGGSILLFMIGVCHADLSAHCSLVVICWEMADLLALLCVVFSCVFVTFPCGAMGQVWYLIISIPDLSLLPYFDALSLHLPFGLNIFYLINHFYISTIS